MMASDDEEEDQQNTPQSTALIVKEVTIKAQNIKQEDKKAHYPSAKDARNGSSNGNSKGLEKRPPDVSKAPQKQLPPPPSKKFVKAVGNSLSSASRSA